MSATSAQLDADECARITRKHARTFTTASQFLTSEKRRATFAVYAFCRVADDYADSAELNADHARIAIDAHEQELMCALDDHARSSPFRELAWAMRRFDIPAEPFHALLAMIRNDLAPFEYTTWKELEQYCDGVASTVGEMCAHVFGIPSSPSLRMDALRDARVLGVALQLTNILRDVGEDAARNRCYLPTEDLHRFDITRDEVLNGSISARDSRWIALMRFEIARTRALYAQAEFGLNVLQRDAQCCARICAWGYAAILNAIELRSYDVLTGRSRVDAGRKLLIMLRAWRVTKFGAAAGGAAVTGALPHSSYSA
jgi:phytoene synthase